jgi:hypothetical protein
MSQLLGLLQPVHLTIEHKSKKTQDLGLSFLLSLSVSYTPFLSLFFDAVFLGYMEPKWQSYNLPNGVVYISQLVKKKNNSIGRSCGHCSF